MIKTGIHTIEQISNPPKFKGIFGLDKRISITLLDQVLNYPNADEIAERILLTFTDERGAYKRTYANRFAQFDATVLDFVKQRFCANSALSVHDVGVSDGRTAVDFFAKMGAYFPNLQYTASDYEPVVYVVEHGKAKVTFGKNQKIIEIVWPPFVFNVARPDRIWRVPINRIIQYFVQKLLVKLLVARFRDGEIPSKEILLFCPKALQLAAQDARFNLTQFNILHSFSTKNDLIRAMNIFNKSYFTPKEFRQMLNNIHNGLNADGFLITGSNQGVSSLVHGGIYQRKKQGFIQLWQSGNGSPIEDLILSLDTKEGCHKDSE